VQIAEKQKHAAAGEPTPGVLDQFKTPEMIGSLALGVLTIFNAHRIQAALTAVPAIPEKVRFFLFIFLFIYFENHCL
jgi:hypothetical protein